MTRQRVFDLTLWTLVVLCLAPIGAATMLAVWGLVSWVDVLRVLVTGVLGFLLLAVVASIVIRPNRGG